jgi:hypothetical protein
MKKVEQDFILSSEYSINQNICKLLNGINQDKNIILHCELKVQVSNNNINLTESSKKLLYTPNAGGSSVWSEAMSFEILSRIFKTQLLYTEMELNYIINPTKITDYSINLYGNIIGVSVTRAMKYKGLLTTDEAIRLLTKKFKGIIESSENICLKQKWSKQILHILSDTHHSMNIVLKVLNEYK